MNVKLAIKITITSLLILSGCTPPPENTQVPQENTEAPQVETDLKFLVEQGNPLVESVGAPYEITADNCQGARDSVKTDERSRTYSIELRLQVSNTVAAEVGGNVGVAKAMLSDEIEVALGITIGTQIVSTSSVTITTPPGQKTIAHLQWKEVWTSGTIAVSRSDGTSVDVLPFSVLNSLTLEQLDVQTINCETGEVVENGPAIQITTPGIPVITPTPAMEIQDQGIPMVLIPTGEFTMGRSDGNEENEKPAHQVFLDDYYIDKYEVTNEAYAACVADSVCAPPIELGSRARKEYYNSGNYRNFPVIHVDWEMANTYCEWRGARLPTEAEWEKAARGDREDNKFYPWGSNTVGCNFGNFVACKTDTTEVGSYPEGKSPYGVYDMAGNVWEWVADWYGFDFYKVSPQNNPTGPETGTYRVFRGGAWNSQSDDIRVTYRVRYYPFIESYNLGFRCAKSVP